VPASERPAELKVVGKSAETYLVMMIDTLRVLLVSGAPGGSRDLEHLVRLSGMDLTTVDGSVVERARLGASDAIVVDGRESAGAGLEVVRGIVSHAPEARIVFVAPEPGAGPALEAITAGAIGFVGPHEVDAALDEAIREVARDHAALSRDTLTEVVKLLGRRPAPGALSPREIEVLRRIAEGQTNQHIARELGVSLSTVKAQLTALFAKLGATDRASALAVCFRRGWLQ
jgi:DNA-binding NarL/FixJ family response regulator